MAAGLAAPPGLDVSVQFQDVDFGLSSLWPDPDPFVRAVEAEDRLLHDQQACAADSHGSHGIVNGHPLLDRIG